MRSERSAILTFFDGSLRERISPFFRVRSAASIFSSLAARSRSCCLTSTAAARTAGDFGGHGLAPSARSCILGRSRIRMLDLDLLDGYPKLFRDDHGHDGLGSGADVACTHVQIGASVGKEFDDHGGGRIAASRKPEAACHPDAPADAAAFSSQRLSFSPPPIRRPLPLRSRHSLRPVVV